jgi:TRAP-type C4-dicarboxylate transport system permease small subunit
MPFELRRLGRWLRHAAEAVLAIMLAGMFGAFVLQIAFRYLLNWPTGWTNEISVILWTWLVFWGASFVLRDEEEIRFDLLFAPAPRRVKRGMIVASAVALVALYAVSLPAIYDYVAFMRVERTAYLKIRFDWLYAIFVVFVVAAIVRHLWLGWRALTGSGPDERDPTKAGSGV